MADFAVRLRELRKDRGLRQIDLAGDFGVAQTTIANYEQHSRFPDEETLLKLATYFEVSLDYLLGRSDVSIHPGTLAASTAIVSPDISSLSQLAVEYLGLLRHGHRSEAYDLVISAAREGTSVNELYTGVLEPALRVVGTLWETNDMDVSQEHYFSEATQVLMAQLHPHLVESGRDRGNVVLVSAGAEGHTIGVRMIGDLLEEAGWHPYYLGGDVPMDNVNRAVVRENARVLAVSVTMPAHIDSAATMISYVRSHRPRSAATPLSIIVGGMPFNLDAGLWKRIGADGHAEHGEAAVKLVETLTATDPS